MTDITDSSGESVTHATTFVRTPTEVIDAIIAHSGDGNYQRVGCRALVDIHKQLGRDGIERFMRWALHPTSGYLAQDEEIKSLPEDIRAIFHIIAQVENSASSTYSPSEHAQRVQQEDERFARRRFLAIAGRGLLYGAIFNVFKQTNLAAEEMERHRSIPQRIKIEEGVEEVGWGVLLGSISGIIRQTYNDIFREYGFAAGNITQRREMLGPLSAIADVAMGKYWDVNAVARAAVNVLESQVSKERSSLTL